MLILGPGRGPRRTQHNTVISRILIPIRAAATDSETARWRVDRVDTRCDEEEVQRTPTKGGKEGGGVVPAWLVGATAPQWGEFLAAQLVRLEVN